MSKSHEPGDAPQGAVPDKVTGDKARAFESIFEAYKERVFSLCRQVIGDPHAAEDALQETFLAVYKALPGFRGESRLSTWIYRIALRTALRVRSRQARRPAMLMADVAISRPSATESQDAYAALSRAIDRLPVEQRIVLQLSALEEFTSEEIAEALGIPEGTVWSRLHAARKELSKSLLRRM